MTASNYTVEEYVPLRPFVGEFYKGIQKGSRCLYVTRIGSNKESPLVIALYMDNRAQYAVQHGREIISGMSYNEARHRLGEVMMYSIHTASLDDLSGPIRASPRLR